jgi:hypothetical protein
VIDEVGPMIALRVDLLRQLISGVFWVPEIDVNRDAHTHAVCANAIEGLYRAVFERYLNKEGETRGLILDGRVASRLLNRFESLCDAIRDAGITLGKQPHNAYDPYSVNWRRIDMVVGPINEKLHEMEETPFMGHGSKMMLTRRLLKRMKLPKRLREHGRGDAL